MKRMATLTVVLVTACLCISPLLLGAQEQDTGPLWNERIASPSYGLTVGTFDLSYGDGNESNLLMPGFELRHFNGINAIEDGGFYFGYEVGLGVNVFLGSESFTGTNKREYQVEDLFAASFFLMGKHGYRWEPAASPLGFGLEIGVGAGGGAGAVTFRDVEADETDNEGEGGGGPIFELCGELALRTAENHRFVARVGIVAGAPVFGIEDTGYADGEMAAARPGLRVGFVRDY